MFRNWSSDALILSQEKESKGDYVDQRGVDQEGRREAVMNSGISKIFISSKNSVYLVVRHIGSLETGNNALQLVAKMELDIGKWN